ncbi:hypothetical protein BS78_01G181000 [Paspalum vaginatum]|nr:hypothetical protein BS78_01G181000 [Paspalum vaginatum]
MARGAAAIFLLVLLALSCRRRLGAVEARPAPAPAPSAAAAAFVRSWCAGTEYPAVCDATLGQYSAEVGASPARLSWAALTVTLAGARDARAAMKAMAAAGARQLTPVAAEAARDCVGMLGDAVDLLRQSVDAMESLGKEEQGGGRDVRFQVDSVRTWASAALTNDDMCVEGFKGEAAATREAVRGHVAGAAHLTANALGIVNAMAKQMP